MIQPCFISYLFEYIKRISNKNRGNVFHTYHSSFYITTTINTNTQSKHFNDKFQQRHQYHHHHHYNITTIIITTSTSTSLTTSSQPSRIQIVDSRDIALATAEMNGDREAFEQEMKMRKVGGGGMRKVGIL